MRREDLVCPATEDYRLLDSGAGYKLEELCGRRLSRPSVQAIWPRSRPESAWRRARSRCRRSKDGGGSWEHDGDEPAPEWLRWELPEGTSMQLQVRLTTFGHCGVFFEQAPLWALIWHEVQRLKAVLGRAPRLANLFGYTGSLSVVAALAGAEVFHVDSAKGVLAWGRENAAGNDLSADVIRWIHDDARAFIAFGKRRGFRYDLWYVDPPAWGHGKKKETWTFESDVSDLIGACLELLPAESPCSLLLSCHTPGVQQQALVNLLRERFSFGQMVGGDLGIAHADDSRVLPAGIYLHAAV